MYVNFRCKYVFFFFRMSVEELIYTVHKGIHIYLQHVFLFATMLGLSFCVCDLFFALDLFGLRSGHTIHDSFCYFLPCVLF